MNEAIYRVGIYAGKIYDPETDPATILECCRLYVGVPIINETFPSDKCIGCNGCPASQK